MGAVICFFVFSKKYEWISTGYLGTSYQAKPSIIPSTSGNITDSGISETIGTHFIQGGNNDN